jgi:hypothetical protein
MAGLEFEGFHYKSEADKESANSDSSRYIDYSVKVVGLLTDKVKAHNELHPATEVTLSQLKRVYREAGKNSNENSVLAEWCLAKVNMFLRMKSGEAVHLNVAKQEKKEMTGLEFDVDEAAYQSSFDITSSWVPSDEDVAQAGKDIEKNNLDFNFDNVDNLYLDEYKRIEIDWS